MERHIDFQKIHGRFIKQFKDIQGELLYNKWIEKKGYDEVEPFPRGKERKEFRCNVRGLEIKELEKCFHVEGLIATSHVDNVDKEDGVYIADRIPVETLESFAEQINTNPNARVMGVHHSEGHPYIPEYFGVADVEITPARVIRLTDGEYGLYVDTKLLKNDPKVPEIIEDFRNGVLNSFSITYDTQGFMTTDFDWVNDDLVRILKPSTILAGYTAASNPKNPNAITTSYGFKEFKELVGVEQLNTMEVKKMGKKEVKEEETTLETTSETTTETQDKPSSPEAEPQPSAEVVEPSEEAVPTEETKEFMSWKANKKKLEEKELLEKSAEKIAVSVLSKMEMKEEVLLQNKSNSKNNEVSFEVKAFREVIENPGKLELKEQFRRAGAMCDSIKLDWQSATTPSCESREYKSFSVNGTNLEYKSLGITTNQNTDTSYLQSSAELQDIYDPVIYNAINQETVTWNLLAKDDFSKKGNNQVQFTLKTAANTSAAFYIGNAVATDKVTRLKFQTKFKKLQVGVSVDGDMIAAARGGPVNDVFAQEVLDSAIDMLSVLNAALFDEVGLEAVAAPIGFEYITDSAGNATLYNLARSSANKLSPNSAGDTFIDQASTIISMANLRAAIRQAKLEGAKEQNLVFITHHVQADLFKGKFDDSRRMLSAQDTDFGFKTDVFVDSIPVFRDKDCNTDDWFLVDLETHRAAIWIPPTLEKLGKNADSEDAFIKTYFAIYNRAPRRMVQIHSAATS